MLPPDPGPVTPPAPPGTVAVVNARVWTGDPRRPWADALVARGDRVLFVGSAAEARKLTRDAPDVRLIDAAGRFVAASPPGVLRAGAPAAFVYLDHDPSRREGADAP